MDVEMSEYWLILSFAWGILCGLSAGKVLWDRK